MIQADRARSIMLQFRWRTATHRLVNHKGKCDSCHVPLNVLRMSLFPDAYQAFVRGYQPRRSAAVLTTAQFDPTYVHRGLSSILS